jgi:hypothetical protein
MESWKVIYQNILGAFDVVEQRWVLFNFVSSVQNVLHLKLIKDELFVFGEHIYVDTEKHEPKLFQSGQKGRISFSVIV